MGWSQIERPLVARDADGTSRTQVRYRVWEASSEQLLVDPTQILQSNDNPVGLPAYNASLPGFPALRLDRYDVSADKPVFDATAYYSNDRRFMFPTNPNQTPDLTLWSGSFERVRIELDFATGSRQVIANCGGEDAIILAWDFKKQGVTETRMKFGRTVRNETPLATGMQAIADNNNKLQFIGGKWYLFNAGNFRQPTPLTWDVTYSFTLDEGTKTYRMADPSLITPDLILPSTTLQFPSLFGTTQWVRPPYCDSVLRQLTVPVPPGQYPLVQYLAVCGFDVSPNNGLGWQSLPGLNL